MKARLEGALSEAGVEHRIETYPAKHGWVLADMPVYDAGEAEHHWRSLTALFDATLKPYRTTRQDTAVTIRGARTSVRYGHRRSQFLSVLIGRGAGRERVCWIV